MRKSVEMNALDRAIAWVAPRVAARRLQARHVLALASGGGYNGARRDRASMAGVIGGIGGSPETDVIADLPTLRAVSRDAERNWPVATAVIGTTTSHAVGTGLSCNPQINAKRLGLTEEQAREWQEDTGERFRAWFGSKDCSLDRRQNGYEMQDLILRSVLSSGDTLVTTPMVRRAGAAYEQLVLQVIEADRISNQNLAQNTDTLTEGVECAADTGEAIAFHVCSRHPGDMRGGSRSWQRIAARGQSGRLNALHVFKVLRPGLRRGVPILAPVLEPLRQLSKFAQAELDAAVASSLFALFAEMDPTAFSETFDEESQKTIVDRAAKWTGEIQSGQVMHVLPGEKITTPTPGRPNPEFDPFFMACVKQIGMATGIPAEVLTMHFQSSYSAARGALLMAWRLFMGWRDFLASNVCQPVYDLWLSIEVASGRIAAPGFFADPITRAAWAGAQWVGDGPGSLDPMKEVGAAEKRAALGITTLQQESQAYDGVDWETKHRQTVREAKARREAGLLAPGDVAAAPPSGGSEPEEPEPPDRRRSRA
jgi:lambda family phage portal protein